jgi:hypothetical protein
MIAQAVRGSFPWRAVATLIPLVACIQLAAGCASYGYAARGPPPDRSTLPIDRMTPVESTQWSFLWGTVTKLWSPLPDPCDGLGAGEVEVSLAWYSIPLAVVTLGTAVPGKITVYCSTFRPQPKRGP